MLGKKLFSLIYILLVISGCASLKGIDPADLNCSKVLGECKEEGRVCVSFGVPEGNSTCDVDCQAKVLRKLYAADISVNFHAGAPNTPLGCVGNRIDFGGTETGAKCITKLLGYEYYPRGCNEDDWPYNVRVK